MTPASAYINAIAASLEDSGFTHTEIPFREIHPDILGELGLDFENHPDGKLTVSIEKPPFLDDVLPELKQGINPKDLIGNTKADLSLIPPAAILHEAAAMADGAVKYGPYNWRENPVLYRVYLAAAMRHIQQLLDGENFDPTSNVHHAGHARACLGIVLDAMETGNLVDDRPMPGAAGRLIRSYDPTTKFNHE